MANDPDRYAALEEKDWNMGPFYVLVNGDTGEVIGDPPLQSVTLYRRVGPHFFENAKAANRVVRVATITLVGIPVE
jgi:hypothetical protein